MKNDENIWICSIDIGKKNFCFYIEEICLKKMKKINNIDYEKRYNENGTTTLEMKNILDNVSKNGKTILHINKDLTEGTDKKKYLDKKIYVNMINHLDFYNEYFNKCNIFIIEEQLSRNSMAIRLGQHCYSYFLIKYNNTEKKILQFPSYYKTTILGAAKVQNGTYKNGKIKWKTIDQKARKKWAVDKAYDILTLRNEKETMDNIKNKSKKDDLSDTICQVNAFKYLYFIDKTMFD
jgi:hypothetical protein